MCVGIEYFVNGSPKTVYFDGAERAQLPIRLRDGKTAFYMWGARGGVYSDDNTPGWLQKFPECAHASLEAFEPTNGGSSIRSRLITASRFIQVNSLSPE